MLALRAIAFAVSAAPVAQAIGPQAASIAANVVGTVDMVASLQRLADALGRVGGSDARLAAEVIAAQREAAPERTGRLRAGISFSREDGIYTIISKAQRDTGMDYAPLVQRGVKHRSGASAADVAGAFRVAPVDYFYGPALAILEERDRVALSAVEAATGEFQ